MPVWRLFGVAQAIETHHVHRKEHSNAAVGVVWPREVQPKCLYREGGSEAKNYKPRANCAEHATIQLSHG